MEVESVALVCQAESSGEQDKEQRAEEEDSAGCVPAEDTGGGIGTSEANEASICFVNRTDLISVSWRWCSQQASSVTALLEQLRHHSPRHSR